MYSYKKVGFNPTADFRMMNYQGWNCFEAGGNTKLVVG